MVYKGFRHGGKGKWETSYQNVKSLETPVMEISVWKFDQRIDFIPALAMIRVIKKLYSPEAHPALNQWLLKIFAVKHILFTLKWAKSFL